MTPRQYHFDPGMSPFGNEYTRLIGGRRVAFQDPENDLVRSLLCAQLNFERQ